MNISFSGFSGRRTATAALLALSTHMAGCAEKDSMPLLSRTNVALSRLSKDEIQLINRERKVPANADFTKKCETTKVCSSDRSDCKTINTGDCHWEIENNYTGLTGTRDLPAGYEVRQNCLGFTTVVREGERGICLREKGQEK